MRSAHGLVGGAFLVAGAILAACAEPPADSPPDEPIAEAQTSCEAPDVREVVERFGERLRQVSLQAPDSILRSEIRAAYAAYVTPDMLDAWMADPRSAPGREVSSPWPERVEIGSIRAGEAGACRVEGHVVHVTSVEMAEGGAAFRKPVAVSVVGNGGWRIDAWETGSSAPADSAPSPSDAVDASDAAEVVRRYYAAIDAGEFRRAYELWGGRGAASGQSFEGFASGFDAAASVEVEVGRPGRVEPAAGSRYVEVPVRVRAVTTSGEEERFAGTYTLRRSVVDGASAEERRWRLYSAAIAPVR